jgi:hypothetical protein
MTDSHEVERRALEPAEREIIERALAADSSACAQALRDQIPSVLVSGGLPTFLDLEVMPVSNPADCPDGPVDVRVLVGEEGQWEGEILVWVKGGLLCGLEYAWFTDAAPESLPEPSQLVVRSG